MRLGGRIWMGASKAKRKNPRLLSPILLFKTVGPLMLQKHKNKILLFYHQTMTNPILFNNRGAARLEKTTSRSIKLVVGKPNSGIIY